MQRLSGTDAGFLAAETATWPMHLGVVAIFDPRTAPQPLGLDQLGRLIEHRLALLGLFRHRIIEVPGRLDRPIWVDVADLDVGDHLRYARLDPPGGSRELANLVGHIFSERLDRAHPLWQLWYVEGLRDGNAALVFKIHHAATDGARGARLFDVIFDLEPDAPLERPDLGPSVPGHRPSTLELLSRAGLSLAATPLRLARAAGDLTRAVPGLARFACSAERADALLPFTAPRGPLNGKLTSRRDFAFSSVALGDVRAVKNAFGVTVNDVALAMCAGALRRYLQAQGALPRRALVAQVPMAVHQEDGHGEVGAVPGNFFSAMGAALPVHVDDPGDRLRSVHASTQAAKAVQAALGDDLLSDLVDVPPPVMVSALVRAYTRLHLDALHPPIFNAIVSNVPGPPVPVYSCGARLLAAYPVGPLLVGSGLNVSVLSYVDSVDIGVTTCPDIVDDPWSIAEGMPDALDELRKAAERA